MRSELPKVLHSLAGKPMLAHVLDTVRKLLPERITVVVGHGADQLRAAFADAQDVTFVHQAQQLGTGHAVAQALENDARNQHRTTLVLYGDVPWNILHFFGDFHAK